jgi:hypothetical protein
MSARVTQTAKTNMGVVLAKGQFIKLDGNLWQFVGRSHDGLQEFYCRALKRHEPFHPYDLAVAWEAKRLIVLPPTDKPAKPSVLRNMMVPFKNYNEGQRRNMKIREHYVKAFHRDFLVKIVTRGPESVDKWLKTITPPPEAHNTDEHLSKYQVPRAYDDWIAGGRCIEALAHGNAFGTHESSLEPVRHIIEAAIEQMHVPHKELEVDDLLSLIYAEIEQAQKDGEVPAKNEKGEDLVFSPCRQTIYNYIDRLNGWEKRRIREGIDEANLEHAAGGRKPRVTLPGEEWQGDHCELPIKTCVSIRDKLGNVHQVDMGAVCMTAIIDVATQYVYPPVLGVDAPWSLEALRTAMCPKTEYFERMGLTGQYDPTIIPQMLFLDNQADNHGYDQDDMMKDMDIENGYAGAYRGDHKESIERYNKRIVKYFQKFPGATPRAEDLKRGKRPRKHPVVPLTIEQIRQEVATFTSEYNNTAQPALGHISPAEAMKRLIEKIESSRRDGQPLPLRSIMEKSVDDIDRMFSIRAEVMVRDYGVRYNYLEWSCDALTNRIGRKVEIRINPRNVFQIWIFDPFDNTWTQGYGCWPFYMQGLPWTEHVLIRARVIKHEASQNKTGKRLSVDFRRKYMANKAEGLKRLFALAGKSFELDLTKKRNDKLWTRSGAIGHLDFAILSTCAVAVDVREGRIPPGMEKIIRLKKEDGVMVPIPIEKPPTNAPAAYWELDDDEDGENDWTNDPLARRDESTTV